KKDKKVIKVSQPYAIARYNKSMGGTDRMNQTVSHQRITIRSKKWYFCIITWLIDVAIQNAWVLYRRFQDKNMPIVDFRRRIVNYYLNLGPHESRQSVGRLCNFEGGRVAPEIRFDGLNHFPRQFELDSI